MQEYLLIRSGRRTLSLEIKKDLTVVVRAPYGILKSDIDTFVSTHKNWILKHKEIRAKRNEQEKAEMLCPPEIKRLKALAKEVLPEKVAFFSEKMKLYPTGIKITSAKTRFGSCSGKNSICFSYQLMRYPGKAIDYVVVHELAHIRHKNHGKSFYALIAQILPDYKEYQKLLKSTFEQ